MTGNREVAEHFLREAKLEQERDDLIADALIALVHAVLATMKPVALDARDAAARIARMWGRGDQP